MHSVKNNDNNLLLHYILTLRYSLAFFVIVWLWAHMTVAS